MSDRIFFVLMGLLAAGVIGLALVYPQGLGARSPGPFGGPTAAETKPGPPPSEAVLMRDLL
ncbi:MAG: hypothetical protein ABIO39_10510 [Caulobacteraceae bacterium]